MQGLNLLKLKKLRPLNISIYQLKGNFYRLNFNTILIRFSVGSRSFSKVRDST